MGGRGRLPTRGRFPPSLTAERRSTALSSRVRSSGRSSRPPPASGRLADPAARAVAAANAPVQVIATDDAAASGLGAAGRQRHRKRGGQCHQDESAHESAHDVTSLPRHPARVRSASSRGHEPRDLGPVPRFPHRMPARETRRRNRLAGGIPVRTATEPTHSGSSLLQQTAQVVGIVGGRQGIQTLDLRVAKPVSACTTTNSESRSPAKTRVFTSTS